MLIKIFRLFRDYEGQSTIIVAISMVLLLGFSAFVVDYGYLYFGKRQIQNAADAAALASAWHLPKIIEPNDAAVMEARDYAGLHNIIHDGNGTIVDVSNYNGDRDKVQVAITKSYPLIFARALGFAETNVTARAVAVKNHFGEDILPFVIINYDVLIGDEYRYHDANNTQPVYLGNTPGYRENDGDFYQLVDGPHVTYGDWGNNLDDFVHLINTYLLEEGGTTWDFEDQPGNFGLADMSDFIDQSLGPPNVIEYVLDNGLDFPYCEGENKYRGTTSGQISAIVNALEDRLGKEGPFSYLILVLPRIAIELQGQAISNWLYEEFCIARVKNLELTPGASTPHRRLQGDIVKVLKKCSDEGPDSYFKRIELLK